MADATTSKDFRAYAKYDESRLKTGSELLKTQNEE